MASTKLIRTFLCTILLSCVSCNLNYVSPIPDFPVYIRIDTQTEYVKFWQSPGAYLTFPNDGKPTTSYQRYRGFGGILVVCDYGFNSSGSHDYYAFDMACPNEVNKDVLIEVDGMWAKCPECGTKYLLYNGLCGIPDTEGAVHPLKRYETRLNGRVISVSLK